MKIKKQLQKIINKLTDVSFQEGKMNESQVAKSIRILKSLPQSESIQALSEYLRELKRKEREHTMYIETATRLSPTQLREAKKIAERKVLPAGRQVKITKVLVSINKEILGGFKMRVGWEIWDGSVLGNINQVKEVICG